MIALIAFSALVPPPTLDRAKLDALLEGPTLQGATASATVTDSEGHILYSHEGDRHVVPASNEKLLTCAFALYELGPDARPVTRIWKVPGGLVLDEPGEPMMSADDLRGIKGKLGDYDHGTLWAHEAYSPGVPSTWEWDDLPNKYAAPVDALTVDRGSFEIWSVDGRPKLLPNAYGVRIARIPGPQPAEVRYNPAQREVQVLGTLPKGKVRLDTLALPRPDEAAASLLCRRFKNTETVPGTPPDLVIIGKSVLEVVSACLPVSDNNLAENLLLMGAARVANLGDAPYPHARAEVTRFLTTIVGLNPQDLHVMDGSGMSRSNYLTTRSIATLLAWADHQPTAAAWRSCLATPEKGTLRGRLKGLEFQGKTGSLSLVSSLSGYFRRSSGDLLIVSLVFNEFGEPPTRIHQVQEEFIRDLDSAISNRPANAVP